jgi:peptidoglycan L-alanyl-D-glutamate endopeptidase CwlK
MGVTLAVMLVVLSVGTASVTASGKQPLDSQQALLKQHGVHAFGNIVVDSAMTYEQALGDSVVPAEGQAIHQVMKPHLRVIPVAYWGLGTHGSDGRIHVGQIVVHRLLVEDTIRVFTEMFKLKFPIHSVIPQSAFGYNDQLSMAANNSSNYRPESGSEHSRAAAFDLNPVQNPFDRTAYDPSLPVEPAGAVYDPSAPGTITMDSALRRYWTSLNWEWGGNWGNPNADPPTDFFRVGYYDYQHFQLNYLRYDGFLAQLPPCMRDWTCA